MKQVRETSAAKSISAWVILKKGKEIATVHAYYGNTVMVDVWDAGPNSTGPQQGRASGYGYDKQTAALAGLTIGHVRMYDHSEQDDTTRKLLKQYHKALDNWSPNDTCTRIELDEMWRNKIEKLGMRFANHEKATLPTGETYYRYGSLYYESGLDRLGLMGFTVIRAI